MHAGYLSVLEEEELRRIVKSNLPACWLHDLGLGHGVEQAERGQCGEEIEEREKGRLCSMIKRWTVLAAGPSRESCRTW